MSTRRRKAEILRESARRGKRAEGMFEVKLAFSGRRAKRTGVGHDFESRPMFGRGPALYHEVKSGNARLSRRQREARKRFGSRFMIHRVEPDFGLRRAARRTRKLLKR